MPSSGTRSCSRSSSATESAPPETATIAVPAFGNNRARLTCRRRRSANGLAIYYSMLSPDQTYQLLRALTSPIVAVTSAQNGKRNGMILDSAIRASIVPTVPRVSVYVHKFNYSHDLIFETGRFGLHLLHTGQFDVIHRLGFFSGRDQDKLAEVPHHLGTTGVPVLDDCHAHFECAVANVMDTGSSTCFLGDVVAVGFGASKNGTPRGEVMTAAYFRAHMPPEWRQTYEALLQRAQRFAEQHSRDIRAVTWPGLSA